MKVGITGWEGFIGSHLKKRLSSPILFQGDLKDLDRVKEFSSQCERVYHIAGRNRDKEGKILENNLLATGNLILAGKLTNNPEIVFASSMQVQSNPSSEYGLTKSIEEDIVKKAHSWCIFRIPNVYGPGGKPFYNSVVATFTFQIAHGQKVAMSNPAETREFIHIEKLVDELMNPRFSEYVPVTGESMKIGDVFDYLTVRLGEHDKLKRCLDYYVKSEDDVSNPRK